MPMRSAGSNCRLEQAKVIDAALAERLVRAAGPLCGPERKFRSRCARPRSGPSRAKRGKRYWQPAKGLRGDINGRSFLAGFRNVVAHAYETLDMARVHAAALRAFMAALRDRTASGTIG